MSFSLSFSASGNISHTKTHALEKIKSLGVKSFFFNQRVIEDFKILNVKHAFLVLELEDETLVTVEVTGTSLQDIFVSFRPGGEISETKFSPKCQTLKLKHIMRFGESWANGEMYNLVKRNCYHFVHDVLERFAEGNINIIMKAHQEEWICKIQGARSLTILAFGFYFRDFELIKDGITGYLEGIIARHFPQ